MGDLHVTAEHSSRSTTATKHPHMWVVAAEIAVEGAVARVADFRGSLNAKVEQRIDALDTYCKGCRRPFAEGAGEDGEALVDNQYLIDGNQSVRTKRKAAPTPPPGAKHRAALASPTRMARRVEAVASDRRGRKRPPGRFHSSGRCAADRGRMDSEHGKDASPVGMPDGRGLSAKGASAGH